MPVQVFSTQGIDQDVLLEPDRLDIVLRHYELTPGVKEISGIRMLDRLQLVNASPVPQSLLAFMLGSEVPAYLRYYGSSDKISSYLQLLAQDPSALLYLGDENDPLQHRLTLIPEPITMQFHMESTPMMVWLLRLNSPSTLKRSLIFTKVCRCSVIIQIG